MALSNAVPFLRRLLLKDRTEMSYPLVPFIPQKTSGQPASHNSGEGRICFRGKKRRDRKRKRRVAYPTFRTHAKKSCSIFWAGMNQQTGNSTVGRWRRSKLQQNSAGNDLKRLILESSTLGEKNHNVETSNYISFSSMFLVQVTECKCHYLK